MHVLLVDRYPQLHKRLRKFVSRMSLVTHKSDLVPVTYDDLDYHHVVGINGFGKEDFINAARFINQMERIDKVIAFNDAYQEIAGSVAASLNLNFPYPAGVCQQVREKNQTRMVLLEKGVDDLPFALVQNIWEIKDFIRQHGYPVVLKPAANQGSVSVTVVYNESDLQIGIERFSLHSPDESMLIEKFIEGKEYSVETFSENGQHRVICIIEKFKEEKHCVGKGHRLPAPLSENDQIKIKEYVLSCLDALAITNGPCHTELILSAGGPRIVETHTRVAGAQIPYMIKQILNVDEEELWIQQVLGNHVLQSLDQIGGANQTAVIWFKNAEKAGILDEITGMEEARKIPGVHKVHVRKSRFSNINSGASRSEDRLIYVIAIHADRDEALNTAILATDSLNVRLIDNNLC